MTDKGTIENGSRINVEICGVEVTCGYNVMLGQPQLAYFPVNSRQRPEVGKILDVDGEPMKVLQVMQSQIAPKMVLLKLEKELG